MRQIPRLSIAAFLCLLAVCFLPGFARAQTPVPVVRAVLFYSPNCGHCAYVINDILPGIFQQYPGQLEMIGIDITQLDGQNLWLTALEMFGVETAGVPFLVVGETYLYGSADIPEQFPGLIAQYLAQGGVDWPAIPGLAELMAAAQATQQALPSATAGQPSPSPLASAAPLQTPTQLPPPTSTQPILVVGGDDDQGLADRLARDPLGNSLAIIVLAGMIVAAAWSAWSLLRKPGNGKKPAAGWLVPVLCLLGLGVAAYLAYVETLQVEAYCGPVGDCNTVQQSEYARLFGILPIGLLGMAGYLLVLAAWAVRRLSRGLLSDLAALAALVGTASGTLFSIYLTFLEPFVIGATCAWCLASAVIMTALLLLSVPPARLALENSKSWGMATRQDN